MPRKPKTKPEFIPAGLESLPVCQEVPEVLDRNLGDVIVRAVTKTPMYNLDPLFEVVTNEALFLRNLVAEANRRDLVDLDLKDLAKVMDQVSRSVDTIIRTIEFANGRADSRPEILMQQTMMELLNDQELGMIEAMYVKAHARNSIDVTPED